MCAKFAKGALLVGGRAQERHGCDGSHGRGGGDAGRHVGVCDGGGGCGVVVFCCCWRRGEMVEKDAAVAVADAVWGFFLWVVGECAWDFMVWERAGAVAAAAAAAFFGLWRDGHEGLGGSV